jgi:hypothetical protein
MIKMWIFAIVATSFALTSVRAHDIHARRRERKSVPAERRYRLGIG